MKKTPKKLKKYAFGGDTTFGKTVSKAKDFGMYAADNALTTAIPGGLGANIIKQDQYDNTSLGRQLGKNQAYKESFDSTSPLSKMALKTGILKNDASHSGNNATQQEAFDQAQPFAQTGSKLGEMWTMKGLQGIGSGSSKGVVADMGNTVMQGQTDQPYPITSQENMLNQGQPQINASGMMDPNNPNNPNYYGYQKGQGAFAMGGIMKYPDGGQYKRTIRPIGMKLSNDEVLNYTKGLIDGSINEVSLRDSLSDADWGRINSFYQSPQSQYLRKNDSNMNFIMPDKHGNYVDSGVSPSEAMLPGMMSRAAGISNDIANNNKISQAIPKLKAYIDDITKGDRAVMQAKEAAAKYSKNLSLKKDLVKQDQEFRKKYDWYYPNNSKSTFDNFDEYANGGIVNGVIHAPELGGYFRKRR